MWGQSSIIFLGNFWWCYPRLKLVMFSVKLTVDLDCLVGLFTIIIVPDNEYMSWTTCYNKLMKHWVGGTQVESPVTMNWQNTVLMETHRLNDLFSKACRLGKFWSLNETLRNWGSKWSSRITIFEWCGVGWGGVGWRGVGQRLFTLLPNFCFWVQNWQSYKIPYFVGGGLTYFWTFVPEFKTDKITESHIFEGWGYVTNLCSWV